jgi:uncharacterized membrane protein
VDNVSATVAGAVFLALGVFFVWAWQEKDRFAASEKEKREALRAAEKVREGQTKPSQSGGNLNALAPVITRTYKGDQERATAAFQADSAKLAAQGYFPTSQSYAPGTYGCGAFLGALLLCVLIIGIVIFLYMIFVKPDGVLSVTYELRAAPAVVAPGAEKTCPICAEQVKAAATICRFCRHEFAPGLPTRT